MGECVISINRQDHKNTITLPEPNLPFNDGSVTLIRGHISYRHEYNGSFSGTINVPGGRNKEFSFDPGSGVYYKRLGIRITHKEM